MNDLIIDNLYTFWKHVGYLNNSLTEEVSYSAVSMIGSDWPCRVFNLEESTVLMDELKVLCFKNKLPRNFTLPKPNGLSKDSDFEFVFGQKNMALPMDLVYEKLIANPNIKRVLTEKDSFEFANTASESFGYGVDYRVVFKIASKSNAAQLYIYQENNVCLGCGIVYFDSNNNAGLHMIGTLPKGRGKGIGKSMTETLLVEAKKQHASNCVLHASKMGESIYEKLGFAVYGEIETYRLLLKD